ncbi:hypothetical protein BDZ89DRAFT_916776, partial [Hymenopellis radicata]
SSDSESSFSTDSEESYDDDLPQVNHWTYPLPMKKEELPESPPDDEAHLLIGLSPDLLSQFRAGYAKDRFFKTYYVTEVANPSQVLTPSRFEKGANGLLYFIDADWKYRLCVPSNVV